ncbi:MAG: formamidopyrimidine-DNA glycosylase [Acidobacteriia bacterium]|nr:formamidopyrimidine-DNA glycosylase [Terriglobia bacterium]
MPELPDVTVYVEALRERVLDQTFRSFQIRSPFLLRTTSPPLESLAGCKLREVRRLGKRILFGFSNDSWLALHLMIAGRLHWRGSKPALSAKNQLARFEFDTGWLLLTEAGTQHRAALHVVQGEEGLRSLDAGGMEVLESDPESFASALRSSNHTLKRALTDPRIFSGIGNAYSDEILHRAQLSPVMLTGRMDAEAIGRLYTATRDVLSEWVGRLRAEAAGKFPEKVTAFRPAMAVHGKYGKPCPRCGTKIQRIRYAANETNYCPVCQTGGKLLADRSLSRLLREDWPRTIEELEALKQR